MFYSGLCLRTGRLQLPGAVRDLQTAWAGTAGASAVGRSRRPARGRNEQRCGVIVHKPKPYRILITDDDRGCREALRDIFEPEGFPTRMASSGEEAVDIVRE